MTDLTQTVTNQPGFELHPLRASLYDELHSRPFQQIQAPARVTHLAVLCPESERARQFRHLQALCELFGAPVPAQDSSCFQQDFGDLRVRRETHMEFVAYTFIHLGAVDAAIPAADAPFALTALALLPPGWLDQLHGAVVGAFHVAFEYSELEGKQLLPQAKRNFEGMRLIGSSPQQGDAHIWTSFRLHSDGFGRFLVYNRGMSPSQLGRLMQRLLEIETYRLLMLLGMPLARSIAPELSVMDAGLADITRRLAGNADLDEAVILAELTAMAARVEDFRAQSTFRFSATRAYHELVLKRLDELNEDEVSGHLTLTEFITRRVTPAVRTCETVGRRLEDLSRRIDRVSDMMRTRVELSIQGQNRALLASMDRRSRIQLMMQHTVEGLSVAAISYYSVGLLKHIITAVYDAGVPLNKDLAVGVSVPLVLGTVWFVTRRIHKHFHELAREERSAEARRGSAKQAEKK
ncbi:DUF3422 family protein [Marinobacterium rhizophilum]|uniref:DUF3422 domain-containing protein n=1 Tax=Marinobacterium rhizophilum TaxID=420402 RepID=A0ABY5HMI2_9GAMM|nr:DUF3422 domain-containing protein [Marinobacterium rhizophilum]UTW13603.1 DUF3422 domain-containing protein [Marinobacterium rhizophilum]